MTYMSGVPMTLERADERVRRTHEVEEPVMLYWPPIPVGMNAIQIIAISHIVSRHCGDQAASIYLIEAAAAFGTRRGKP